MRGGQYPLPCEKIYDISDLHSTGRPIYEISCLAIDPGQHDFSKDILFPLFKFMYGYMNHKGDEDALWVIIVNPKYTHLYRGLFGFEYLSNGREVRPYAPSNNAPVNGLYLDLSKAESFLDKHYGKAPAHKNLSYFFTKYAAPHFVFPEKCANPVCTHEGEKEKSLLEKEVEQALHRKGLSQKQDCCSLRHILK